ncbi:MAG: alkylation repair protein [Sphingomonas bacterium]|uniref:DNA alkylation repair protein n=1 Tax=Sphingomonas bacterium TaxID=1895847 RepID=UPI002632DC84|nr:DNA alkylation repair protein [Sphingomonas bacterium]MDB5709647.1 alkylation repair protein [Sphingomonas bacterium]
MTDPTPASARKEIFNADRIGHIAAETRAVFPTFDTAQFIALCSDGLDDLSLMARLRRVTEALHATLPDDYRTALEILRRLAPRLNSGFVTMVLPDYVALYGQHDFDISMEALKFFTVFGSSEFAVRHFLRCDLNRGLAAMERWARDENEHVRRLASEGSRPRLPWSFKLAAVIADPSLTQGIIDTLKTDPSRYVRKSVANHLNDVAKDNPEWMLARIEAWPRDNVATTWIARHALRTLIKRGDQRALAILGAGDAPEIRVVDFTVSPRSIPLGDNITLSIILRSTAKQDQRLVIDYAVHYVKKSGATAAKVFKLRTIDLKGGEDMSLTHRQPIRDFTTRTHHPGLHKIDLMVNGRVVAQGMFDLHRAAS